MPLTNEILRSCSLIALLLVSAPLLAGPNGRVRPQGRPFDPDTEANAAARAYFAPSSSLGFRMMQPNGMFREFEHAATGDGTIVAANGWRGKVDGDRAEIYTGRDVGGDPGVYTFSGGHLVAYSCGGRSWTFEKVPMAIRDGSPRELWPRPKSVRTVRRQMDVWRKTGRLRLGFVNPNRAGLLFAELALLALALLSIRRRWCVVLGVALAAVFFYCDVRTGSRGGVLAFLVGLAVFVAFRLRLLLSGFGNRKRVVLAAAVALVACLAIFLSGAPRVTSRLLSTRDGSNRIRLQVLRAVPRMMVDAPGGWSWYAGGLATGAGKAYVDWYQRQRNLQLMLTLVSDHLTRLVQFGWVGRFGYTWLWLSLMALLVLAACRKATPLPLALWTAFLIAVGCNRVMESLLLWCIPTLTTLVALPAVRRAVGWKRAGTALAASAVITAAILGGIYCLGSQRRPRHALGIRTSDRRIYVKDASNPACWVVDDETVFGGGLTANEIRYQYRRHRKARGIGYVRNVFDLPKDVHRLVLGGRSGWDFLMGLNDGKFPADFNVPESIVFVSPPFPPQAIPDLLLKNAKVRIVIGEFLASYYQEYCRPPDWVQIVPGAELYVPDWLERAEVMQDGKGKR